MDEYDIIKWLSTRIDNNTIFEHALNIEKQISVYLHKHNLKLNCPDNIFLMQLVKFLRENSSD